MAELSSKVKNTGSRVTPCNTCRCVTPVVNNFNLFVKYLLCHFYQGNQVNLTLFFNNTSMVLKRKINVGRKIIIPNMTLAKVNNMPARCRFIRKKSELYYNCSALSKIFNRASSFILFLSKLSKYS